MAKSLSSPALPSESPAANMASGNSMVRLLTAFVVVCDARSRALSFRRSPTYAVVGEPSFAHNHAGFAFAPARTRRSAGRRYAAVIRRPGIRRSYSPPCFRRGSAMNSAVTDVLGVATATEPYSGQRFFQVSTKWLPWSSSTPQILKWMRTSAYREISPGVASGSR